MKSGIEIITTPTYDGKILQETYDINNDVRTFITSRMLDTRDEEVKKALIELGWTPPIKTRTNHERS